MNGGQSQSQWIPAGPLITSLSDVGHPVLGDWD